MLTLDLLLGAVLLVLLPFLAISARRRLLAREGGAIEVSLRLKNKRHGGGWVLGVGRYAGDDLQWFRVFSLSPRPRRTLSRRDVEVRGRRQPKGPEALALLKGVEVIELVTPTGSTEIALDSSALTGFLAWLEARPPGATLPA
ncbi:MAG: hypothetical protein JWO22_3558 [Frankiales bacterium]|nr:hypothetical protein [Frankiales bacterium]